MLIAYLSVPYWQSGDASALAQRSNAGDGPFVGNRNTKVFHRRDCSVLSRTSAASKIEIPNAALADSNGFRPCRTCRPVAPEEGSRPVAVAAVLERAEPAESRSLPPGSTRQDDSPPPSRLRFSRDVAPVLVGNCVSCHNPEDKARRANLDLTTFQGLLHGGDSGPAVVAGKPEQSTLMLRLQGRGVPKMPPGNRDLAPETIVRIGRWIEEGALLDEGLEPTTALAKLIPSPTALRQEELAKLPPNELDARTEEAARDRWKKATSQDPRVLSSDHFLLLTDLPEKRAETVLKPLETQWTTLRGLLGPASDPALGRPTKIAVIVFGDPVLYAEFARAVDQRELDAGTQSHANLSVDFPYLAASDPLLGADEPSPTRKDANRPPRSLVGLLSEQLATEAVRRSGNPPQWLALGLGAFLAQRVDPASPDALVLRREVIEIIQRGGMTRTQELIGGQGDEGRIRALGFSLLEWLNASYRPSLVPFVRAMLPDGSKFDEVIQRGFQVDREQFLGTWAAWATRTYSRRR